MLYTCLEKLAFSWSVGTSGCSSSLLKKMVACLPTRVSGAEVSISALMHSAWSDSYDSAIHVHQTAPELFMVGENTPSLAIVNSVDHSGFNTAVKSVLSVKVFNVDHTSSSLRSVFSTALQRKHSGQEHSAGVTVAYLFDSDSTVCCWQRTIRVESEHSREPLRNFWNSTELAS